jgi:hypothetical protein
MQSGSKPSDDDAVVSRIGEAKLCLNADGSLIPLEPGSWFVCFVPPIDKEWWHRFFHRTHKHVFALRPEPEGEWTVFEPWWTRLLVATITTEQAARFLSWGARGDVLLVQEEVPGHSSQLRGWMTCAVLVTHMLGRSYFIWTPHQLYRRLIRETNICRVDVSALLKTGLQGLTDKASRFVWGCDECRPGGRPPPHPIAEPFCMRCARDQYGMYRGSGLQTTRSSGSLRRAGGDRDYKPYGPESPPTLRLTEQQRANSPDMDAVYYGTKRSGATNNKVKKGVQLRASPFGMAESVRAVAHSQNAPQGSVS